MAQRDFDPGQARTMAELRGIIDALDRTLVDLLARRQACIDQAIRLKPAEGIPARDPARVREVLGNVRARAAQSGLDPDLAGRVWEELIDWAIAHEERALGPGAGGAAERGRHPTEREGSGP
ncbi:MAG: chorismate mutase [Rhodobacteraceae bacterium]|nr:chorismate mutase [Paracoccaceae bacterium]